jgi:hypothetical protein
MSPHPNLEAADLLLRRTSRRLTFLKKIITNNSAKRSKIKVTVLFEEIFSNELNFRI